MKCYPPGKCKTLGLLRREAAMKQFLFSLVVSHVCQCSCLEVKGFLATPLGSFCNPHNHLMIGHKIRKCWMNDSSLGALIYHSFIPTTYWAHSMHPTLLNCRGSGWGELVTVFSGFFCCPGNFSTLYEDYFLGSWLSCDILIMFIDTNIKGWTQKHIKEHFDKLLSHVSQWCSHCKLPWGYAMSTIFSLYKNSFHHHPKIAQHQLCTADFLASLENNLCGIGLFSNALQLLALEAQLIQ